MPNDSERSGGLVGLAVGMAVCCGLPILLGAGIAIGTVGLWAGSALLVAAGVGLAGWGLGRRRRPTDGGKRCSDQAGFPGE